MFDLPLFIIWFLNVHKFGPIFITCDTFRDGIQQQLGGCLRDFRNKPYPVRVKLEYFKKALSVSRVTN